MKIEKKIVGYAVKQPVPEEKNERPELRREGGGGNRAEVIRMHEKLERPEVLIGSTYKVKTPVSDHAMYVTINDIILNEGTEHEKRRPFEIFINSKNLDHYQWIVALTRIISAVFRKGGDVAFLVDELKGDEEIDYDGETHTAANLFDALNPELDEGQQKLIAEKRAEFEESRKQQDAFSSSEFPEGAQLCKKCNTAAVIMMDGCMTCLSCGDSKCG
jgi:hypothetical protein